MFSGVFPKRFVCSRRRTRRASSSGGDAESVPVVPNEPRRHRSIQSCNLNSCWKVFFIDTSFCCSGLDVPQLLCAINFELIFGQSEVRMESSFAGNCIGLWLIISNVLVSLWQEGTLICCRSVCCFLMSRFKHWDYWLNALSTSAFPKFQVWSDMPTPAGVRGCWKLMKAVTVKMKINQGLASSIESKKTCMVYLLDVTFWRENKIHGYNFISLIVFR